MTENQGADAPRSPGEDRLRQRRNFGEALPELSDSPTMARRRVVRVVRHRGNGGGMGNARLRGVVFDMDGTLVVQELDFEAIRREIGLPTGTPLLEALEALPAAEQGRAWDILDRHERRAAEAATLVPGVADFLAWLEDRGVRRGVLTHNSRASAGLVLARCGLSAFDPVVAREDGPYKPHPAGIWRACEVWGVAPVEVLMLG